MPPGIVPERGPIPNRMSYTADVEVWQRWATPAPEVCPGVGLRGLSGGQNRIPRLKPTQLPSPRSPLYSAPAKSFQNRI